MLQSDNIHDLCNKFCILIESVHKLQKDIPEVKNHESTIKIDSSLENILSILKRMKEVEKKAARMDD